MFRESTTEEEQLLGLKFRIQDDSPSEIDRPLLLLIHGRAGDSKVMWIFAKAFATASPLIIAPEGDVPDYGDRTPDQPGFSWWPVHGQRLPADASQALRNERLREVELGLLKLKKFIDNLPRLFKFDPQRAYAAGFSQGGAAVGSLSLFYPELFKGAAVLGGFIPYAILDSSELIDKRIRERTMAPRTKYFFFHGNKDPILPVTRNEETRRWLLDHGADVTFSSDDVGHKVSSAGIKALTSWFEDLETKS